MITDLCKTTLLLILILFTFPFYCRSHSHSLSLSHRHFLCLICLTSVLVCIVILVKHVMLFCVCDVLNLLDVIMVYLPFCFLSFNSFSPQCYHLCFKRYIHVVMWTFSLVSFLKKYVFIFIYFFCLCQVLVAACGI